MVGEDSQETYEEDLDFFGKLDSDPGCGSRFSGPSRTVTKCFGTRVEGPAIITETRVGFDRKQIKIMDIKVRVCNRGKRKWEMRDFEIEKSCVMGVI